jgi:hypothetical protein
MVKKAKVKRICKRMAEKTQFKVLKHLTPSDTKEYSGAQQTKKHLSGRQDFPSRTPIQIIWFQVFAFLACSLPNVVSKSWF